MTDTKTTDEKTLAAKPKKTLTLKKPVDAGAVRQNLAQGRNRGVVVEKVKRRTVGAPSEAAARSEAPVAKPKTVQTSRPAAKTPSGRAVRAAAAPAGDNQAAAPGAGVVLRTLTESEQQARTRALVDARERELEARKLAEVEAEERAKRDAEAAKEKAEAAARKVEEDARRTQESEAKRKAEEAAAKRLGDAPAATTAAAPAAAKTPAKPVLQPVMRGRGQQDDMEADDGEARRIIRRPGMPARPAAPPRGAPRGGQQKQRGRLTVANATADQEERTRSVASFRRRMQRLKGVSAAPKEKLSREVILPESITVQEFANRMSERAVDVIRLLMKQSIMLKATDLIDLDTAELVAEELGHTVKRVAESDIEEGLFDEPDDPADMEPRPPVVTIMGHVDHGKTSLLDAIREANVVSGEAGGITQHIGAYQVTAPNGAKISFIDTPGHAAFTAMRARGAKVTDIVILVVAADDGIKPQTLEAIAHAKAAGVPMIVAINKIDKPEANPMRVRSELLQHEVQVESMGGETLEVEVSALQRTNLDKLLEGIALQAELLELKANPNRKAEGTVVEALLDRGRGPVATVLVQRGTLRTGDIIVAGAQWGHARALIDDTGRTRSSAGPSMPVEVLGFGGAPEAGDRVAVVDSESRAREICEYRERRKREEAVARTAGARGSLVDMMSQLSAEGRKEFPLIIKGDVQGSVEAIIAALEGLGTDEVGARVIHSGVGGISESDVTLAEASGAVVLGFNVRAYREARDLSERSNVEIRYYNVIYNLVDDIKAAMSGLLSPDLRETMLGNAEILEVFNISKVGKVAGCRVSDGKVERGAKVRLIRDNVVIHEGSLSTLKRFKDEVRDVQSGQECGMSFENYEDIRAGDVIECYRVEEIARTL